MQKSDGWDHAATDYDDMATAVTEPFICDAIGHLPAAAKLERVLDCATGTGHFPLKLLSHIPTVRELLATDFSPKMVEIATRKLHGHEAVKTAVMDATDLAGVPSDHFDLVSCFFGVMFFPDRKKGFQESLRVLKPQGTFVMITWKEVGFFYFYQSVKKRLAPESPLMGMIPMNKNEQCLSEVREAGFTNVRCFNVRRRLELSRDLVIRSGLTNPVLRATGVSEDAMRLALIAELDLQFPHGGDCVFEAESIVTLAQKP